MESLVHQPVLLREAVDFLQVKAGEWYIDATLGGGGHTREILKRGGSVLGIDQDVKAISRIKNSELRIKNNLRLVEGNFANLAEIAVKSGVEEVAGILFDLGVSSEQLADPETGISFQLDVPLDMRLSRGLNVSAADLLNALPEKELARMFKEYGDEPRAKKIARAIAERRKEKKFERTWELAGLITHPSSTKSRAPLKRGSIHPATKVFQALRIAVNRELDNLKQALPQALELLKPGGRLVVISFHSGEDRIVKQFLKENSDPNDPNKMRLKVVTKKPMVPSSEEVKENPRARSAKLRVAEKV